MSAEAILQRFVHSFARLEVLRAEVCPRNPDFHPISLLLVAWNSDFKDFEGSFGVLVWSLFYCGVVIGRHNDDKQLGLQK